MSVDFRMVGEKIGSVVPLSAVKTIARVTEPKKSDQCIWAEEGKFIDNLQGLFNSIFSEYDVACEMFAGDSSVKSAHFASIVLALDLSEQGCFYGPHNTFISGACIDTDVDPPPSPKHPRAIIKVNPRRLENIDSLFKYVQYEFGIKNQAVWDKAVQDYITQSEHIVQALKK